MRLVVDGLIFQKDPHGGVARVYKELLPRLCDLEPGLQISLFIDGPLRAELPAHPQIQVNRAPAIKRTLRVQGLARKIIYPFRRVASLAWNRLRQRWLGEGEGAIWQSTFFTLPAVWKGSQAVMIYDLIPELFPEYYPDPLDEVARRQKRRCVTAAQAVLCISETTRQDAARFYPDCAGRMVVTPLACSPYFKVKENSAGRLAGPPFLLYVGGRAGYKNFSGLLEAYRTWPGRTGIDLRVVGPAWSEAEQRKIHAYGLEAKVSLLSDVDDRLLLDRYNQAAAFVYPSRYEGFGIPLLEAMACGCPVVASNIPVFREVARDVPYYFTLDQSESLHAALDLALAAGRSSSRVTTGLERVKEFSWEKTAAQVLAVYHSIQP